MAIDPTKKYSNLLHPQNYCTNTRFPDSIISEFFNFIPEQLNELKVSGRDSLFSITQNLLIRQDDSSTKKAIKAFFYVVPVIPAVIGATSIIDNICKVFKNDVIQELDKNLIDHYLSCEEFVKELTDPLHYFSSKQYQDLKTELD